MFGRGQKRMNEENFRGNFKRMRGPRQQFWGPPGRGFMPHPPDFFMEDPYFGGFGGGRGHWGGGMDRGRGGWRGGPSRGPPPFNFMMPRPQRLSGPVINMSGSGILPKAEVENMTSEEKFRTFVKHVLLKKAQSKTNPMNTVELITNSMCYVRLNVDDVYRVEQVSKDNEEPLLTGALNFETFFLARTTGCGKKELKLRVYEKAMEVLANKTVSDMMKMTDPGADSVRKEYEAAKIAKKEGKYDRADVEKGLREFAAALKKKKEELNAHPVLILEQAAAKVHETMIKHSYSCEQHKIDNKRICYLGRLKFGDIILGRGRSLSKKQCKYMAYKDTINRVTTKSIEELMESMPEEPMPYTMAFEDVASASDKPHEERIKDFINTARTLIPEMNTNLAPLVDAAASHGLTVTTLNRFIVENSIIQCEIYIGDIFAGAGEATSKRESLVCAYKATWETVRTNTAAKFLENRRLTEDEMWEIDVFSVKVQGEGRMIEANGNGLVLFGHDLNTINRNRIEDMVIIEGRDPASERLNNAFNTLKYSCCQNGLLMQLELKTVKPNVVRCVIMIQKKQVAMSYGHDSLTARNLAAVDILYKLYQTNDVIKVVEADSGNDEHRWISWETIEEEAEKLRKADEAKSSVYKPVQVRSRGVNNANLTECKVVQQEPDSQEKDGDKSDSKEKKATPDPYIMQYMLAQLEKLAASKRKEELVFGPGIRYVECIEMKARAREMKIKYVSKLHEKKCYTILYKDISWQELANVCKDTGKYFGKYVYCYKKNLPKYADVAGLILKDPEAVTVPERTPAERERQVAVAYMQTEGYCG